MLPYKVRDAKRGRYKKRRVIPDDTDEDGEGQDAPTTKNNN